ESQRTGRRLDALAVVAAKTAQEDNTDRPTNPLGTLHLGLSKTKKRKSLSGFGQEADRFLLTDMDCRPARQRAHEVYGTFGLDGAKVVENLLTIDLLYVHGEPHGEHSTNAQLAPRFGPKLHATGGRR